MAGKSNRGLPPSFSLDIPDPTPDAPVQLGDYLDEVDAAPLVSSKPALPRREETSPKVVEMRRPTEPKAEPSSPLLRPNRASRPGRSPPRSVGGRRSRDRPGSRSTLPPRRSA